MGVAMAKVNPFWDFSARGVRIDDPRRPYVVVSNHESFADILLISHVGWEMKWMSKIEIMRIPFAGWGMIFAGDIAFRRETARGVLEAFRGAQKVLKHRVSVMIFPEGTRSGGRSARRDGGRYRYQ
jgi:1-acyl-sn-glycerol-3-phosphate acyltransferase